MADEVKLERCGGVGGDGCEWCGVIGEEEAGWEVEECVRGGCREGESTFDVGDGGGGVEG